MGLIDNIKKEAMGNRTKIQTSEASDFEKILNAAFYLPKDPELETEFVKHVMTRGLESQERVGLHASAFIKEKDFCVREQVLSLVYKQLQSENVPVGLKRIFEEGNAIHEKWQRLFLRAGYCGVYDLDYTQFNDEYKISFTPDIICTVPEFKPAKKEKMVGEIKSVNTFQFQKMIKHPSAGKQLQWYMHLTGIHKGFVLSEDKNSQDFKIEYYVYDKHVVAPFIEKAEEIMYNYQKLIEEKRMIKRPKFAKSHDSKKCQQCNMRNVCWGIGDKVLINPNLFK